MNEPTVRIKRPPSGPRQGRVWWSTSQFQLEVPPHLARDFGLCVLTPLTRGSRIIDCHRLPLASNDG